jgi:hypothetical protein
VSGRAHGAGGGPRARPGRGTQIHSIPGKTRRQRNRRWPSGMRIQQTQTSKLSWNRRKKKQKATKLEMDRHKEEDTHHVHPTATKFVCQQTIKHMGAHDVSCCFASAGHAATVCLPTISLSSSRRSSCTSTTVVDHPTLIWIGSRSLPSLNFHIVISVCIYLYRIIKRQNFSPSIFFCPALP